VIGDKGYDSDEFVTAIEAGGATAVIPPRENRIEKREYDKESRRAVLESDETISPRCDALREDSP